MGNCTSTCSALPATEPQATITASGSGALRAPYPSIVAIMATFQMTGAV